MLNVMGTAGENASLVSMNVMGPLERRIASWIRLDSIHIEIWISFGQWEKTTMKPILF